MGAADLGRGAEQVGVALEPPFSALDIALKASPGKARLNRLILQGCGGAPARRYPL
jgi:hypothetical protein